ncbi:hypothetical protein AMECASPLE_028264 [Ameca splendens]|uniref:Uncharacterized protein n=1 Tax=Ameca splendens TaxID=208324 RepID=A0ABV1A186_9TELE
MVDSMVVSLSGPIVVKHSLTVTLPAPCFTDVWGSFFLYNHIWMVSNIFSVLGCGTWRSGQASNAYTEASVLNAAVPGLSPNPRDLCCMSSPSLQPLPVWLLSNNKNDGH